MRKLLTNVSKGNNMHIEILTFVKIYRNEGKEMKEKK